MTTYEVIHEDEKCIGCGACVSICPENWELHENGKSKPKKTKISEKELDSNMEAANVCPVNCIHIKDGKKNLI
jgi:ferredoxin